MKRITTLIFFLAMTSASHAQFADISSVLGIDFGYGSGEYGGGVSFVDFNQDGLEDLTFASGNGDSVHFLVNNGMGYDEIIPLVNISDEVKQVLWVDYDNDNDLDLYLAIDGINRLYRNDGALALTEITATCGFNDPFAQSFCASWLDYDEDALPDLCISHRTGHLVGSITLYHNLGGDMFEDVTMAAGLGGLGSSVLGMATLDMNNDGFEDIYVGQDFDAGNLLLRNNGDGTFANISASSNTDVENNTMTCTVGDYNNDGWMDLYVSDTNGNSMYRNLGDETFAEEAGVVGTVLGSFTWGALFVDGDNDMDLDLYVCGVSNSPYGNYLLENTSGGTLFMNSNAAWGFGNDLHYSTGSAIGDYNNDGQVDIAKSCSQSFTNMVWQNNFSGNNYLSFDLEGVVSNSQALGAVVEVVAGGVTQTRRVGCGEGFSSQNSFIQYFGMGSNTQADSVIVTWPNGLVTTLLDVPANQQIYVLENAPGCMDMEACNYDSTADSEDSSLCTYPGCTDLNAATYEPEAGCDDGSCLYPANSCPADLNYDGIVDVNDLLLFLGLFGDVCN
ncbi:MAG: hypothetical protein ACI9RU_001156 [Litorivivens sp.]|jgi:hypothetical protein